MTAFDITLDEITFWLSVMSLLVSVMTLAIVMVFIHEWRHGERRRDY